MFDTVIEHRNGVEFADRPFGKGDNPKTASAEFKKVNSNFGEKEALTVFKNWFVNQQNYIQSTLNKKVMYSNSYSNIPKAETNKNFDGMFNRFDV